MAASLRPPERSDLWKELRTGVELLRLPAKSPKLATAPRGDGSIVVAVPGFGATDISMRPMRGYLKSLGWRAVDWGQGRNDGQVEPLRDALLERVERLATPERPVAMVGWSLGGVLAREVARDRPDLVRRVVTYGTPLAGGPRYTNGARRYDPAEIDRIEELIEERNQTPIRVPVTAMYSKNDGIVAWRACLDDDPNTEMIEVSSSHIGMGIDPDVWRIVADRLAR